MVQLDPEKQLAKLRAELEILRKQHLATLLEIEEKNKLLEEMRDSFSWRLTAPFRSLCSVLRLNAVIDFFLPRNSKRRLLFNMGILLLKDPKRLVRNLSPRNVALFFYQFNKLQPSVLEYEVKKLISSEVDSRYYSASSNFKYFDLFKAEKQNQKILVIDRFVPAYDTNSGALRMFTILNILKEIGYSVTFMPDDLQAKEPYVSELKVAGIEVVCGNVNLEDFFRIHGPSFDVVMLSEPQPAFNFTSLVRAYAVNCKLVYDTVDLHWVRIGRAAEVTHDKKLLQEAEYFKKVEMYNILASDLVLTVTEDEKQFLQRMDPDLRVEVLPNIHADISSQVPPFSSRKDIMFIGHFLHDPNVDAVKYFVREVFPLVKAKLPGVKFYIVGSNPTLEVLELNAQDVEVTGYVKDVTPYFDGCRVFVAPLRFGAGMKGKIGHSMTLGLPVVTTSIGAEGMGLVDGENVLIAEKPQEFAEAVVRLYLNEELWKDISSASISHINRHYSKDAITKVISEIFGKLEAMGAP